MSRRGREQGFTPKTCPDWFYQSCVVQGGGSQRLVMYYTTEAESNVILSVHIQDRVTGARETVPVKAFFEMFQPVDQDNWVTPPKVIPKREAERLELT